MAPRTTTTTTTKPAPKVLSQNPEAIRSRNRRQHLKEGEVGRDDEYWERLMKEKKKAEEERIENEVLCRVEEKENARRLKQEAAAAAAEDDDRKTGVVSSPNHNMYYGSARGPFTRLPP
jgi:hypothetical protein